MCFGRKEFYNPSEAATKPVPYPPQQPTYAPMPKQDQALMASTSPQETYSPPPGPPSSAMANELDASSIRPPPGPPPSHPPQAVLSEAPGDSPSRPAATSTAATGYAPPPGPSPSHAAAATAAAASVTTASATTTNYAPPLGPPPAFDYTAPPSGPPPPSTTTPQHDWQTAVPDTSEFPPPPDPFQNWDESPTNNATAAEHEAGMHWCRENPLSPPIARLDPGSLAALASSDIYMFAPSSRLFHGELSRTARGVWSVHTSRKGAPDSTLLSSPPLYCATQHSPLLLSSSAKSSSRSTKMIYYEIAISPRSPSSEISVAIGFAAIPYPPFRLPGWHRGSLAVHGDDGHRYAHDYGGGHEFVAPFRPGQRVGLGMTFSAGMGGKIEVEVFFTRDGRKERWWDLHEEVDAEADHGGVFGLEGFHDLYAAVGTFNSVNFEVVFDPNRWIYKEVLAG